jgi:hypothetical protein
MMQMKTVVPAEELQRRRAIRLAHGNLEWQEVVASFALSGISVTDTEAALAGRMLSGQLTYDQALLELGRRHTESTDV